MCRFLLCLFVAALLFVPFTNAGPAPTPPSARHHHDGLQGFPECDSSPNVESAPIIGPSPSPCVTCKGESTLLCDTTSTSTLGRVLLLLLLPAFFFVFAFGADRPTCRTVGAGLAATALTLPSLVTAEECRFQGDPRNTQVLSLSTTHRAIYERVASELGFTVHVVGESDWLSLATSDFAQYRGILFGDPDQTDVVYVQAGETNKHVWSAAVDGNIIVTGTDEASHSQGEDLIRSGMAYVLDERCKTGLYVSLSQYYEPYRTPQPVALLSEFGHFESFAPTTCFDDAHIVAEHPALEGLTDDALSNWGCSVHEVLSAWPARFVPLAIVNALDYEGDTFFFPDGSNGIPYLLVSGGATIVQCSHNRTKICDKDSGECRYQYETIELSSYTSLVYGGKTLNVTGPCFDQFSEWKCQFGARMVNMTVISPNLAQCVVPAVPEGGEVLFAVSRGEYNFYGGLQMIRFTYRNPFTEAQVFVDGTTSLLPGVEGIESEVLVDVSWDRHSLTPRDTAEVDIAVFSIQWHPTSEHYLYKVLHHLGGASFPNDGGPVDFRWPPLNETTETLVVVVLPTGTFPTTRPHSYSVLKNAEWGWTIGKTLYNLNKDPVVNNRLCNRWADEEREDMSWVSQVAACLDRFPLTACGVSGWSQDPSCRNGEGWGCIGMAYNCATHPSGAQCCYMLGDRLVTEEFLFVGVGTADKSPAGDSVEDPKNVPHFVDDVLPYLRCCEWSIDSCHRYFDVRPGNPGGSVPAPPCNQGFGDAHFSTPDGFDFTFNGIGQYVLAQSSVWTIGVELAPLGQGSVVGGVAILDTATGNQYEITSGDGVSGITFAINDVPMIFPENSSMNETWALRDLTFQYGSDRMRVDWFHLGIIASFWYEPVVNRSLINYLDYSFTFDNKFKDGISGLLGNFNGDPSDDLRPPAPNDDPLPANASLRSIHYDFGMQWLLDADNEVFSHPFDHDPAFLWEPAFEVTFGSCEEKGEEVGFEERALEVCGDNAQCLFDAAATCSLQIAGQTRVFVEATEFTSSPTTAPSASTNAPSAATLAPTSYPSEQPTELPTSTPTNLPSRSPTKLPTGTPTHSPSGTPTNLPTRMPTKNPTKSPSTMPTKLPTTEPRDKKKDKNKNRDEVRVSVLLEIVIPSVVGALLVGLFFGWLYWRRNRAKAIVKVVKVADADPLEEEALEDPEADDPEVEMEEAEEEDTM